MYRCLRLRSSSISRSLASTSAPAADYVTPRGGPQLPDRSARLNWIGSRTGSGDDCTSGISAPRCEAPSGDRGPPGGSGGLLPLIDDPFDLCRDGGRTSARTGGVMLSDPVTGGSGSAGVGIVLARE